MKRTTFLILASVLLVSCGGEGGEGGSASCDKEYWDGTVGVCLPKHWVVIDRETLRQRGVPDDTIAAFQSEDAVSGQFPTVTVTREPMVDIVTAEDYSEANIRSVSVLPGYDFIDSTRVSIDSESVSLHIFTAQPRADESKRRFYQVSTVSEEVGYTITGTGPVSVDDGLEKQLLLILQSTTFQGTTEEEE